MRLAQACEGQELAAFGYRARDGAQSERRVEPYRLVATQRRWYLVAFDLDRRDWRTFRVDRVSAVRMTGHTFVPRPLADPARLVSEAISTAPYLYQAVVTVHASAEEVEMVVPPGMGVVEAAGRRRALLRLGAESLLWIASYLVETGLEFEVLEPTELRDHLKALGERLIAAHGSVGS